MLLSIANYGINLRLGYFWDDWFVAWNFHAMGAGGVFQSYAMYRPLHGYVLGYLMEILGEAPMMWHVVGLLVRYALGVAVWMLINQLWPKRVLDNILVAALFIVYPGFTQQAMPIIYIVQVFGSMGIWALSNCLMIYALMGESLRRIPLLLSYVLTVTHLMLSEYFIGLEFVRPLILGIALANIKLINPKENRKAWLRYVFHNWLPYLAMLGMYLVYRLIFFRSGRSDTDGATVFQQIMNDPIREMSHRVASALTDPLEVVILAWLQPLKVFSSTYSISPRTWWACVLVAAIVSFLSWRFLKLLEKNYTEPIVTSNQNWEVQYLLLGLASVFLAGLPIWGMNFQVSLGNLGDRYSFPFIFGSVLILAGVASLIRKNSNFRYAIFAVLIGMSTGFHISNALLIYQRDWNIQEEFHSQLVLRVPGLKKGTSIWVTKDPSLLAMEGDYGLAMPVNWIYATGQQDPDVDYWVFPFTEEWLNRTGIFRAGFDGPIQRQIQNVVFNGDPSQTIVVWFAPPGCLRIIDSNRPELAEALGLPEIARSLAGTESILVSAVPPQLPNNLFGRQEKNWCSYFQQADLALQIEDWQKIIDIGMEAEKNEFGPSHASEWIPFVEAYVRLGRYDDASVLIDRISNSPFPATKTLICGIISRIKDDPESRNNQPMIYFLSKVFMQTKCSN